MKIKKILFLLLFPFIAEFAVSCCKCDDPVPGLYTNESLNLAAIDNSAAEWKLSETDTVVKTAYGIQLQVGRKQTACIIPKTKAIFSQSAYAFTCKCLLDANLSPKDSIVDIQIISLNDFDNSHLANTNITNYFKVLRDKHYNSIPDYLSTLPHKIDHFYDMDFTANLMLMSAPSQTGSYGFEVSIHLSDGRVLMQTIYNTLN